MLPQVTVCKVAMVDAHVPAQLHVKGHGKIFGVFNFWANLNRHVHLEVVRVGEERSPPTLQAAACSSLLVSRAPIPAVTG